MLCFDIGAYCLPREVDVRDVGLDWSGVYYEDVALRTCLVGLKGGRSLRSGLLLFEEDVGDVLLWLFGVEQQSIPYFRFLIWVYPIVRPTLHLLEVDVRQMRFQLHRIKLQVVPINIAF